MKKKFYWLCSSSRQKLSLLVLFFLLAVLPLGVSLVQKRQEYRGKAQTSSLFSDDFETDLSAWTAYQAQTPNTITLSSTKSQSGSKAILLHYENGKDYLRIDHVFPSPQTGAVSIWFWDDMDTSLGTFVGLKDTNETQALFLGVNTNVNPSEYFYRTGNPADISSYIPTHVPRSPGWHKFELISTPKGSYGKIDGVNLAFLANNDQGRGAVNTEFTSFSKIILASTWDLTGDAYYDNLQVTSLDPLPSSIAERERVLLQAFAGQPLNYLPQTNPNHRNRQKGNRATVLALLNQNKEETKNLIKEVIQEYNLWGKIWGAPLPAADLGIASWLLWNDLDLETKTSVKNVIVQEADYWAATNPQSGYDKDSKAEENAWTASFLALAANMFPQHANAGNWDAKAKLFAFHTLTVNESYGGITTQTLWPDYLLDNHNFHPHPHYALSSSIGELARGALFYKKTGKSIPEEFKHSVLKVWDAHKPYVNFINYQWQNCPLASQFKGKDDWYADATTGDNAFTYVTLLSGTDVISDLTAYEFYILQDWKGAYPLQDPSLKYLLDSVDAKRNGVALLYYDDSLKLEPITAIASLSFKIKFQGINQQRPEKTVRVILKQQNQEKYSFDSIGVSSDQNGIYTGKIANINPDTYDLFIKGWSHLQEKFPGVTLNPGANNQNWSGTILKAGDIDGNNLVNAVDIARVIQDYFPNTPAGSMADFNLDGTVNAIDIGFVIENYFQQGD